MCAWNRDIQVLPFLPPSPPIHLFFFKKKKNGKVRRKNVIRIYILFIYLFIFWGGVLGLRFCARAFPSCGKRGPLFIAVCGPLTVAASLVAEHRLQTRRLSSCGSRAHLLRGTWDLPRPGLEPTSPALAGSFSTTAPPVNYIFLKSLISISVCKTSLLSLKLDSNDLCREPLNFLFLLQIPYFYLK